MFATLVSIEKPISEDVVYTMRQACLAWKQVRSTLLVRLTSFIRREFLCFFRIRATLQMRRLLIQP
jgi:hypothetical protein